MQINVLALSYLFPNRAQPGYGIFVLNRLKAVSLQDCTIKVIAPVQWYPFIRRLRGALWGSEIPAREEIQALDVHHPRFAVIPRYMKWLDAITYFWSVRAVLGRLDKETSFECDLIDVHWTYPDIFAAYLLARMRKKKFIVTVRGHEALYEDENTLRRRIVAALLRRADAVVALSDELRDKLVRLGVDAARVHVVLNGVDLDHFSYRDRAECRRALGLESSGRVIVSVGRLTKGKGHQDLIRAVKSLGDPAVSLYIIGGVNPEDDFRETLRALIRELGVSNVHLLDRVDHSLLPAWYGAADVFALATKREGCPNVVLEALACGAPVVVSNVGAVDQLVAPGVNGELVPPENPEKLADALRAALGRDWDRKRIAAMMRPWGWEACGARVREIYRSVLA